MICSILTKFAPKLEMVPKSQPTLILNWASQLTPRHSVKCTSSSLSKEFSAFFPTLMLLAEISVWAFEAQNDHNLEDERFHQNNSIAWHDWLSFSDDLYQNYHIFCLFLPKIFLIVLHHFIRANKATPLGCWWGGESQDFQFWAVLDIVVAPQVWKWNDAKSKIRTQCCEYFLPFQNIHACPSIAFYSN